MEDRDSTTVANLDIWVGTTDGAFGGGIKTSRENGKMGLHGILGEQQKEGERYQENNTIGSDDTLEEDEVGSLGLWQTQTRT